MCGGGHDVGTRKVVIKTDMIRGSLGLLYYLHTFYSSKAQRLVDHQCIASIPVSRIKNEVHMIITYPGSDTQLMETNNTISVPHMYPQSINAP